MGIIKLLPLLSAVFVFFLGVFIFYKNRKSKINLIFLLFSISIFLWLIGTFMMFISITDKSAFFWDKFTYIGVVFIPSLVYHFGIIFVAKIKQKRITVIIGYVLSILFLVLNLATPLFIKGIFRYGWGVHSKAQFFHHIFLIFFALYLFLLFKELFIFYNKHSGIAKEQTKYLFLAFLILTVGSLGFLPAYGISIYPFAYISGLLFTIMLAYTIVRHRLMDIKLVLRHSSVYLASLASVFTLAFLIKYIFIIFSPGIAAWIDIVILISALSAFSPIKNYYYRLANKYFFSSLYESGEVIALLSDKLRSTLDIGKINKVISDTFIDILHIKSVGILMFNKRIKGYTLRYNKNFNLFQHKEMFRNKKFLQLCQDSNEPIVIEELKEVNYIKYKKIINLTVDAGIEVLLPLSVKDKIIGLVVLSAKESRDMYNDQDLRVLEIIGSQTAIAMENAMLYEETKNFNIKLKKEIEKAVKQLKTANIKLKKLDEAKSEFISIASHQLRTPLTVIKGYLSMIKDGDFGKLGKKIEDPIEKIFESSQRLISLVANLLNISRIESGRLKFNFTEMQLEDMIESVMEELKNKADEKGLEFTFKRHKKPLPKIRIDEEKIRQVVANIIDNSIKYTDEGKVEVQLNQEDKNLYFCVKDTGAGIKRNDIGKLFQKFSRGTGKTKTTDGTGLGLFVARQMVEAHKGSIWVESKGEGHGSKFCFTLPIKNNLKSTV